MQCVTPVATGNCVAGPNASLFNGHYNNWAPRIGIASAAARENIFSGNHQDDDSRGIPAKFYVESYLNTLAAEMANQPPFATANTQATLSGTNPTLLTLQNGLTTVVPNALTNTVAVNPNYQVPYALLWNASIEYTLPKNMFVEVMYTGTRGVHLDELLGFSLATNTASNAAGFTYDTTGRILQSQRASGWCASCSECLTGWRSWRATRIQSRWTMPARLVAADKQ